MLAGALLILVASVGGGYAWSSATDEREYWMLAHDVTQGTPVSQSDLRVVNATIGEDAALIGVGEELPAGAVWTSDQRAGAFVTMASWTTELQPRHEVPLSVAPGDAPVDLARGDVVDVWVADVGVAGTPVDETAAAGHHASRALEEVRVVDVGQAPTAAAQTVLIGLDEPPSATTMASATAGRIIVVRRSS